MCGIYGIVNNNSLSIDKEAVKNSAMLMKHRGPDAYQQWGLDKKIELAHLRLSIIDLTSSSNQPFISSCQNFVIVFNGEIFNYLEIKIELQALGYNFKTNSDTEVLLNAYIEWKDDCVQKFNGDWAFAIYDIKKNELFCSRDRYGVKPFNYAIIDGHLIFSSEIKSIIKYFPELKQPNYNVISNFCRNSLGAQNEETWFIGVKRLLPAHNLKYSNGKITISKYWNYPEQTINTNFENAKEEYNEIFQEAVKIRMRSDVPVGTTLSSGVDSSSIVSVLRQFYNNEHKTFTAKFDKTDYKKSEKQLYKDDIEIDEAKLVARLANDLDLKSHFIEVQDKNFVSQLNSNIYYLESGHASPATIPLSNILDFAKDHVTVVMEGQGADELLGGYISNAFPFFILDSLKKYDLNSIVREIKKFSKNYSKFYSLKLFMRLLNNQNLEMLYHKYLGFDKVFGEKLTEGYKRIKDYPIDNNNFNEYLNSHLYRSHTGGLVNLLHYGDAISMSKSMESRNPFVDFNLVEYSFKLPYNFKVQNGQGKYIHRKAMHNITPAYVLDNPLKFGFTTPLSKNFQDINSEANKILLSDKCINRNIFNYHELKELILEHTENKSDHSSFLFRLLSVELWFRTFIDK
jgi:asparagine synthase (glutamine-hydrolysing)